MIARIEAARIEPYPIRRAPVTIGKVSFGRTGYRFRGDASRLAFAETAFRRAIDTNSPPVARSMVDVAQARNGRALRVSGNEDFRRLVWPQAMARGVKAPGREPNPADREVFKRGCEARVVNRAKPARLLAAGREGPSGRGEREPTRDRRGMAATDDFR